ncbi:hypothetical protein M501DRAFT_937992 [Patellaria atrata CBS 101060]|uniref:BZIP domain-containing protein n=1 Tax=Patellaria atrata CBS 101060 TaxID=1346257 RepID=A0A9P4VLC5_9PEZI|nr:hypothetical protein M501DRAFT_937992 [Patellaria atrata CBS 101060]
MSSTGSTPTPEQQQNHSDDTSKEAAARTNLEKKRARDRKSQRAMRDRTRWQIHTLTEQVTELTHALNLQASEKAELMTQLLTVSEENDHLRIQKAALQLRLLAAGEGDSEVAENGERIPKTYEQVPWNTGACCMSDQILQRIVDARHEYLKGTPPGESEPFPERLDFSSLFDTNLNPHRSMYEPGHVIGDIVRSYKEIETLPKQVAVYYCMYMLLKWLVLRSELSYKRLPVWLRPEPAQLEVGHSAWIDRLPWPKIRTYVIENNIPFDDFAAAYSSSFNVKWDYDPSHVLISVPGPTLGTPQMIINPIYEEHVRQLSNWTVGPNFRRRFPEMARIVDEYTRD